MLFSIAIIFCLFVVTSVGATGSSSPATGAASTETRHPKPGEIVEVWSVSLKYDPYKHVNTKENYRLAVFVSQSEDNRYYGTVVPVIPANAPSSIFPLHLRESVVDYFDNQNLEIKGYGSFVVLEGYFNLGGSQRIRWSDLKLSETPTTMNDEKFKAMTDKLDKINDMQGMPPLETLNLGQAMATNKEKLNIQTGQVVEFRYGTIGVPRQVVLGVAVCWTGKGRMAIIAILKNGPKNTEEIKVDKSNFHNEDNNLVISGEFDLTGFRFVPYTAVKPQSATFHNEVKFNQLVKTIDENMKKKKREKEGAEAEQSLVVQNGGSSSVPGNKAKGSPWQSNWRVRPGN